MDSIGWRKVNRLMRKIKTNINNAQIMRWTFWNSQFRAWESVFYKDGSQKPSQNLIYINCKKITAEIKMHVSSGMWKVT